MNVNRAGEIAAHQRYWMIGSENDKFETLTDALWSQFEMIIGEFPFAEGRVASFFEMFYMFSYAMLVFVLLINSFLLAVVVGPRITTGAWVRIQLKNLNRKLKISENRKSREVKLKQTCSEMKFIEFWK